MSNVTPATAAATPAAVDADVPEHQKNDKRMSDLMRTVNKFGEEAALGRDSLPKLAHAVVKAASDGVIDAEFKNKEGEDAATIIYKRYSAAESKKAIHEHSAGGVKANISKLRQLIQFGALTSIDAVEVMTEAMQAREAMKADDEKVLSSYPYYVEVARSQQKSPDKQLTKAQLEKLAIKPEPNAKELDVVLKQIEKLLEGVVTGENRHKVKDDNDLTEAAYNAIKERIGQLATLAQHKKMRDAAAKLGLTLA